MALDLTAVELPIVPSPDAAPFWSAVERGELVLPSCATCGPFWYPRILCPACGRREISWTAASGRGAIHAFCIHHHSALPHLRPLLPVVSVLVELEEGPRMMGLLDAEPDPAVVTCGMKVEVDLRTTGGPTRALVFVPTLQRRDP